MSFILDALRKSEIERQRQSGPSIAEIPLAREDRRLPVALVAIGVLLAVNVGVLLFFLLRDSGVQEPTPPVPEAAASAPPPVVAALPVPVTPAPSPDPARSGLPPGGLGEPSVFYPSQVFSEPATMAPDAPDPTLLPGAPAATFGGSVTYGNEPPRPFESLPTELVAGLPELTVDLHIFTDEIAKRAVFINGRRYTQGATLTEGPRVEEITRDGAVLNFRGRRFLLPRQ
ncbi:MAG: general secretion pathway protein GspB [Steroidobacteraceae bacterium]